MEATVDWPNFANWLIELWNFRIFAVDEKPITLGKVIVGVLLFIIGYVISRYTARQIERRLLARFDIEASMRYTIQTVIFYLMLVVVTLFVLRLLNVPITVFTVLGGALAIGVGFGSQNIVNNFISGMIIMLERPVRVGDFIEVGGLFGTVENIGARSTRVKSVQNTHIVVPNSSFLEQNVLNWTLSDNVVRTTVRVGVAYGSPTRQAADLLLKAVVGQDRVLATPDPVVLFSDFADNSLNFDVLFWTQIETYLQLKQVESAVRFRIDDLFREHNISIAFPQRDVHLDTISPLTVRLVNETNNAERHQPRV